MTEKTSIEARKPEGLPDVLRHYIDGEFVDSIDGDTFEVLDPVTNEPYLTAASGKAADIDRAVAAGARCLDFRGGEFTPGRVGDALASRDLNAYLRALGVAGPGPAAFSPKDRSRFASALDAAAGATAP